MAPRSAAPAAVLDLDARRDFRRPKDEPRDVEPLHRVPVALRGVQNSERLPQVGDRRHRERVVLKAVLVNPLLVEIHRDAKRMAHLVEARREEFVRVDRVVLSCRWKLRRVYKYYPLNWPSKDGEILLKG